MRTRKEYQTLATVGLLTALFIFVPVTLPAEEDLGLEDVFNRAIEEVNQDFNEQITRLLAERDAAITLLVRESMRERIADLEAQLAERDQTIATLRFALDFATADEFLVLPLDDLEDLDDETIVADTGESLGGEAAVVEEGVDEASADTAKSDSIAKEDKTEIPDSEKATGKVVIKKRVLTDDSEKTTELEEGSSDLDEEPGEPALVVESETKDSSPADSKESAGKPSGKPSGNVVPAAADLDDPAEIEPAVSKRPVEAPSVESDQPDSTSAIENEADDPADEVQLEVDENDSLRVPDTKLDNGKGEEAEEIDARALPSVEKASDGSVVEVADVDAVSQLPREVAEEDAEELQLDD